MTIDELKKFIKAILIIVVVGILLTIGRTVGRWQADDWSTTREHIKLESYGYSYCPYCGEELKKR